MKSKKRYTEKIPKHTKIASFLLHLTPALSSSCLRFIFIVPPLYLHCTFTFSSLCLRFILIVLLPYLHCAFVHSSPVCMTRIVLPPPQSPFEESPHLSFVTRHSSFLPLSRHYTPPLEKARERFLSLPVTKFPLIEVASDSWVCEKGEVSFASPSLHTPSPWERDGVRILFLSPRNPVFNIFSIAVLYYESTFYTPFLYQSSKIRISFL